MKELVEAIAKALVDNPDQVQVRAIEGEQANVFECCYNRNSCEHGCNHFRGERRRRAENRGQHGYCSYESEGNSRVD